VTALLWLTLGAVAGYLFSRLRPWQRLGDWADWQVRHHPDRWIGARGREAVLFAALLATQPARAVRAWRHRNDCGRG
jgi:hypothetical protein